ncbi:caspase family protein [Saccharothrix deserti]|uniref:caspase family protein n=1 Tax=Saccharothrix deserti TaxID=2593674 RepID=UPI00131BB2D4|nr:caspase family protein [Saccharothrix deserti]
MAQRTLTRGSQGEDVRRLQLVLKQANYDPGQADGIFGERTENAVTDFQRDHGLEADGKVGPKTWGALTALHPTPGAARGRSLHIGLNFVDDAAYGMTVPPLRGCENDARDMTALAQAQRFESRIMLNGQATASNVIEAIRDVARELESGDFFFLTYSGHGSQMRDATGEEPDQLDETWVLYDRQLLDDELSALWGEFRPGVRIMMLSDSCHSGTVSRDVVFAYKAFAASFQEARDVGFFLDTPIPMLTTRSAPGWDEVEQSLREVMPTVVAQLQGDRAAEEVQAPEVDHYVDLVLTQLEDDTRMMAVSEFSDTGAVVLDQSPITRNLPPEIAHADQVARWREYSEVKKEVRNAKPPQASVLLISGCQDNQLSLDGVKNGLFTQRLLETWSNGRFSGNYRELHRQIVASMPPQQTPNYFWDTNPPSVAFELQRPFTI